MNQNSKTSGAFSVAAPFLFLMFFAASVACRDNTAPSLTSVTPEIRSDDHADLDDWTLIDLAKTEVKFSDFRGEVIFLNRWATWCGPCVHEMPTIQALYEKMGDRIKIICVSQEDLDTLNQFQKKNNYTFPIYSSREDSPKVFNTEGIPATFIINRQNEVVFSKLGMADWSDKKVIRALEELL